MHKKHKAIGLISGGLDSILATKMIDELGIEILGLTFTSPFCLCVKAGCHKHAKILAEKLQIELSIIINGMDYVEMVKNPCFGYGRNLNPCIDCRIFMLQKAKIVMEKNNAHFVFTGEVLGERPMSQNLQALKLIERESGLVGRLLRPLSAQLLEPTIPETSGIIDRTKLGSIKGRSRKPQLELAKKYNIKDFPQPAGGCLLTDKNFAERLKDAFRYNEDTLNDINLLKIGRHFRINLTTEIAEKAEREIITENTEDTEKDKESTIKIIVGRNEQENAQLLNLAKSNDLILEPVEIAGPVVLVRNYANREDVITIAAGLCARYSDKENNRLVKVKYNDIIIETEPLKDSLINEYRI